MSRGTAVSQAQMNRVLDVLAARGVIVAGVHLLPDKSVKFLAAGANENIVVGAVPDLDDELSAWAATCGGG